MSRSRGPEPELRPGWRLKLKWSPLYRRLVRPLREGPRLARWHRAGRPAPPPEAWKRRMVAAHVRRFAGRPFIETGTCEGEMVAAIAPLAPRVVSIELHPRLAALARARFRRRRHVQILTGDSEALLPRVLDGVAEPCLFWLDAHATSSGARGRRVTPIRAELAAILAHPVREHVVLIDDARLFAAGRGYPSLDELRAAVAAARPEWSFELADDVVRILPR